MKILVVRLSSIGDIFQAMTVLSDIKQYYPDCQIDWLVDKSCANVVKLSPLINNIIEIPMREWKSSKIKFLYNLHQWKNKLTTYNYDYIIDIQGLLKSAKLLNYFNGKKYGYSFFSLKEKIAYCYYNKTFRIKKHQTALNRMRELVAISLGYKINLDNPNLVLSYNKKNILRNMDKNYIILFHGTSKTNKEISLDNWINLTKKLLDNYDGIICSTYSNKQEYDFVKKLVKGVNNHRLKILDKMSFEDIVCFVDGCDFVIGVDTGFTHLASLMKKPTIGLYTNTDPELVGLNPSAISINKKIKNKNFDSNNLIDLLKEKMII